MPNCQRIADFAVVEALDGTVEFALFESAGWVGKNFEIGLAEMVAGRPAVELVAAAGKMAENFDAVAGIADLHLVGTAAGVVADMSEVVRHKFQTADQ